MQIWSVKVNEVTLVLKVVTEEKQIDLTGHSSRTPPVKAK